MYSSVGNLLLMYIKLNSVEIEKKTTILCNACLIQQKKYNISIGIFQYLYTNNVVLMPIWLLVVQNSLHLQCLYLLRRQYNVMVSIIYIFYQTVYSVRDFTRSNNINYNSCSSYFQNYFLLQLLRLLPISGLRCSKTNKPLQYNILMT